MKEGATQEKLKEPLDPILARSIEFQKNESKSEDRGEALVNSVN